ncbi:MAG: heparan-alpha-glucosaminide N-acetyltransferase domain-containing protein [Oscillospiraceae bacterium]|nr:heparan-alpha-glucosaminide N-acetyltransferase domain-containing protein [Oscillospiraceae bacterium]
MGRHGRIYFLDEARGLSILLMVLHHAAYDAAFLQIFPLGFLGADWFGAIRAFFAGVFVLISGAACRLSRSNLRRGAKCLLLAAGLWAITGWLFPAQPIRFGVLHLLGCAMLLFACLRPLLDRIPPSFSAVAGCTLFFVGFGVPAGRVGFGPVGMALPAFLYRDAFTAAFGFPGPGYFSADYFPLIPWLFLFWAGTGLGVWLRLGRGPRWLYRSHSLFLAAAGRRSLWIYLVHQPVLYLFFLVLCRWV